MNTTYTHTCQFTFWPTQPFGGDKFVYDGMGW